MELQAEMEVVTALVVSATTCLASLRADQAHGRSDLAHAGHGGLVVVGWLGCLGASQRWLTHCRRWRVGLVVRPIVVV
jgi:hypothetical protein